MWFSCLTSWSSTKKKVERTPFFEKVHIVFHNTIHNLWTSHIGCILHSLFDIGEWTSLRWVAAQVLSVMEESAEEEIQGMSFMNFFIMWLCFYTYCIIALYVGSWDRQHMNPNYLWSENTQNHRQVRQENQQITRLNAFSPLLENDDVLTISLWMPRTRLLINISKYIWDNIWRQSLSYGQMLTYPNPWILCRVTISTMSSFSIF